MATCWWKSRGNARKIRTQRPSDEIWPNSSQCPRQQLRHRKRWRPWGFPGRRGLQHGNSKSSDHGERCRSRRMQQIAFPLHVLSAEPAGEYSSGCRFLDLRSGPSSDPAFSSRSSRLVPNLRLAMVSDGLYDEDQCSGPCAGLCWASLDLSV